MKPWRQENVMHSLPEVHSTIRVPKNAGFFKTLMAYLGPGMMIAVGYMDPGNWATDIAGGAKYGYMLRPVSILLWILAEIAIAATDLAEVIGSAIALNLLFGLPLTIGVSVTVLDVLLLLYLQNKGFRVIESIVASLIILILFCFAYEIIVSKPDFQQIAGGLLPRPEIVTTPGMLYIAIGILGATVMPHNLYLHSSIVQTRDFARTDDGRKKAIKFATIDSTISLLLAFFINAAILILSAAAFHNSGNQHIADITDAYHLLDPLLGVKLASVMFAVALLASGQNSTLTGTLAGQIVMEGFLNLRLKPWLRRLITRLLAVIPALIVAILYGEQGTSELLVLSQVNLSLQLSFAVVPLVQFTSNYLKMGPFVNPRWITITSWAVAFVIICLNGYLLWETLI
jgi:manganese transport protein